MEAEFKKVASASRDNFISEAWQRDFGPGFERDLFNKSSTLVHLTPVASDAPEFKGQACIVLDRERKAGTLYCRDLPADGQEYKLVLVDKDGRVVKDTKLTCVIRTSDDTGTKFRQKMQEIPLSSGMSLAVIAAGSSSESPKFLLRTGNL
jgi:hypothetical protein